MDYISLSKILPPLIYPFNIALGLLLISLLLMIMRRRTIWSAGFLTLGLTVLVVCGNPTLARTLYSDHERIYLPAAISEIPNAEAIVLLGGSLGLPLPPRRAADLSGGADRILHTLRLFRAGKAPLVIVTSGNVFEEPGVEAESVYTSQLLQEWGVPESAIITDERSRNTYENALYTKEILDANGVDKILLVTSALHMPRAAATFRSAGIDLVPAPTDYNIVITSRPRALGWIPQIGAVGAITNVLHEKLGIIMYRLRGWIR